jgi:hypothetical protein
MSPQTKGPTRGEQVGPHGGLHAQGGQRVAMMQRFYVRARYIPVRPRRRAISEGLDLQLIDQWCRWTRAAL